MPLTSKEEVAVEVCREHLDRIEPSKQGVCYSASMAILDYLGGPKAGYHLTKGTHSNGTGGDHYWITSKAGTILDALPDVCGDRPVYRKGERVARRNTFKSHLPLVEVMRAEAKKKAAVANKKRRRRPEEDLFGRQRTDIKRDEGLTEEQQDLLYAAWRELVADWAERPEEFIRSNFSKGALAVHFVNALLFGKDIPRTATLAYTPQRFKVPGSAYSLSELFPAAVDKWELIRGIRFILLDDVTSAFGRLLSANLPIGGHRIPADFPISLAKNLINEYCPKGGRVLDPCHGWGGRLVGFMLSKAGRYVGVDPAPHSACLDEMFADLEQYLYEPKAYRLINKPFEDVAFKANVFDFAFTSPPYFDTERYEGKESSWRRYKTVDDWVAGFYRPMLKSVAHALKPKACFALQISTKLELNEIAMEIARDVGLKYLKRYDTAMRRYNSVTAGKGGSTDQFEIVAIFRKV